MRTIKSFFLGIVLGIIPCVAFAQNSTNSPYTYYGYGNIADKAFISQRGMGGIGYGLRNSQMINPMNPASFSAVDSMTFMFDFGVTGQVTWMKEGGEQDRRLNGNLEYIAMQFPLAKKLGFGAGFEPVSNVGYKFAETKPLIEVEGQYFQEINVGTGGLSKVYGVLSYDFLSKISVGAKLSYLFGDIKREQTASVNVSGASSGVETTTLRAYGLLYDFGLQYHQAVGKFQTVTIGAIYSPKTRFGAKVMKDLISSGSVDVIDTVFHGLKFEMPETYGLGITYNKLGKLTVGADVLYQRWADVNFYDQTDAFYNRLKFNAGGEYIPNRTSSGLLNKMQYRAGLSYSNSYLKVRDSKHNEYGVNLGLGIPMPDRRSSLNLAFEYSLVRPEHKNSLSEQYFKVSLSYTFNEIWFFKRKVQ